MKLRPGISPTFFWTTIGVGLGGTAASALSLTAYAWAPTLGALLVLIVGFFQARLSTPASPPPPAPPAGTPPPEGLEGGERRPPSAP